MHEALCLAGSLGYEYILSMLATLKSIYPPLIHYTLFKFHKLCLAIHTLNAVQGLESLGHGHDLDTFNPLLAPHSFTSLHALM